MHHLRALIRERRHLFMALLVLAFCIKAVIPAGFMVSSAGGMSLSITICSESTSSVESVKLVIPAKKGSQSQHDSAKKDGHCAFSGLSHSAVGGAGIILLALAFAFILVLGMAPSRRLPFSPIPYLLPPLRGPPAVA